MPDLVPLNKMLMETTLVLAQWRLRGGRMCQIRASVMFGEAENQRVTSVLRIWQASQVTVVVKILDSAL